MENHIFMQSTLLTMQLFLGEKLKLYVFLAWQHSCNEFPLKETTCNYFCIFEVFHYTEMCLNVKCDESLKRFKISHQIM